MRKVFYLTYMALILFYSCATVPKGEKEIWDDATPPPDYNPVFIQSVQDFNPSVDKPKLVVSGINSKQPNAVKAKIHLVADDKIMLRGAHKPEFRNIWCQVEDSINGKWVTVKNFKLSEVTEETAEPLSLALVTDHSGSMGDWRAEALQSALKNIVGKKRSQDYFAIIKYDSKVITEAH